MRLDLYLVASGLALSRTEAKGLIEGGFVTVSGKSITKPSYDVKEDEQIEVDRSEIKFASRAGHKLKGALDAFGARVKDKLCIDIGASSGGFTDCLLINGAKHVIAIDTGKDQLIERLRQDSRVTNIENYNARNLRAEDLEYVPDFAVMDVSFISATYIIPRIFEVLNTGGEYITLIKPQFEVGRAFVGKGGIVKDTKAALLAVERVIDFAKQTGFEFLGSCVSPIKGTDGNTEYLAYFRK